MHSPVPIHHQEFLPEVGHPGVSGVVALKSRDEGGFFLGSAITFQEVPNGAGGKRVLSGALWGVRVVPSPVASPRDLFLLASGHSQGVGAAFL
jgi:hypothetical protein